MSVRKFRLFRRIAAVVGCVALAVGLSGPVHADPTPPARTFWAELGGPTVAEDGVLTFGGVRVGITDTPSRVAVFHLTFELEDPELMPHFQFLADDNGARCHTPPGGTPGRTQKCAYTVNLDGHDEAVFSPRLRITPLSADPAARASLIWVTFAPEGMDASARRGVRAAMRHKAHLTAAVHGPVTGQIGDVVDVPWTVTNVGPDELPGFRASLTLTAPGGTEWTGAAAARCDPPAIPKVEYRCVGSGILVPGATMTETWQLRITSTTVGTGRVTAQLIDSAGESEDMGFTDPTPGPDSTADIVVTPPPARPGDRYVPVGPVRVLDTRDSGTPVAPGGTVTLPVAGRTGVPATGVTSVTMNVTVTEPTREGFLTVHPDGKIRPNASNLNWVRGQVVPNLVVVPVVNGKVNFHNTSPGTVHLVADLVGYHTTGAGSSFTPIGPVRALDTRDSGTPVAPGGTLTLPVAGRNGVPVDGVTAVTMNVTVTEPTREGFLTVYPDGKSKPNASSLNWVRGQVVPNLVVVPVVNGKVNFHNTSPGTVHLVADVVGYHTTGVASTFQPFGPYRALDTRDRGAPVAPGGSLTLVVGSVVAAGGVTAVTMNVTVTEPTREGFLTVYPDGRIRPNASNLNWVRGQVVPNLVVVPVVNGKITFHNTSLGTVHVIADVVGYHTG
ncbi:hypothetical protein AB0M43_28025 [Longispora sp. NPDC051575]|uniref:hypothetical protein n=1 Tax=Longispora sp. NPDC051575 TaxID=3154943 RepID=UPI0034174A30